MHACDPLRSHPYLVLCAGPGGMASQQRMIPQLHLATRRQIAGLQAHVGPMACAYAIPADLDQIAPQASAWAPL